MNPQELRQHFHNCMPLFIALGDEIRLNIIELLTDSALKSLNNSEGNSKPCHQGLSVKEITEKTSLSRPAISHHLKILKEAGLVGIHKQGTHNYYYLTIQSGTRQLMKLGSELQTFLNNGSR